MHGFTKFEDIDNVNGNSKAWETVNFLKKSLTVNPLTDHIALIIFAI